MTQKLNRELNQFPEWDLRTKTIDTRFTTCRELRIENEGKPHCTAMKTFYWVGVIDTFDKKNINLYFTTRDNKMILDQHIQRDDNLKPISSSEPKYNLESVVLDTILTLRIQGIKWLHVLIEETVCFDGRHIVKLITSGKDGSIGYPSLYPLLDDPGKAKMKEIFKTGLEKEHKKTLLHQQPYSDEQLDVIHLTQIAA